MAYFAMIDVEALQEEARLERRTNVGLARQVWAQTLKQRASTMAYMLHGMPAQADGHFR